MANATTTNPVCMKTTTDKKSRSGNIKKKEV